MQDYKRYKIFDDNNPRSYPAITKSAGDFVEGKILFDVNEKSAKIIDFFEDTDYEKKIVVIQSSGKYLEAVAYVCGNELKNKLKSEWDKKEFEDRYLDVYISKEIPETLIEYNERQK